MIVMSILNYPHCVTGNKDVWMHKNLKKGHKSGNIWLGLTKFTLGTTTHLIK